MKYKHIFWDWNGTLLDDIWLSTEVVSNMLSNREIGNISQEEYKASFGFPVIDFYRQMNFDFERESFEQIGEEFIANYNSKRHLCELHEGAYELISELSARGVCQSVVSAYQENFLKDVVHEKGLAQFMHSIIGLDNILATSKVERAKEHFLALGISPKELLFVGDTEHDSHAAQDIGCDCVFVSHGHCSHERLEALNSHKVFFNHAELRAYLAL